MIRYALVCDRKHDFEIWFKNSADYDKQAKRGLVTCPSCGSAKVEKALMAPSLGRGAKKRSSDMIAVPSAPAEAPAAEAPSQNMMSQVAMVPPQVMTPQEQELRTKLKELREHLIKNSENVGSKFPEVARKMHYGEIEHKSIYGEASPREAKELHEEGVEFHPIPVLPDEHN
jgi:hypothetical protein